MLITPSGLLTITRSGERMTANEILVQNGHCKKCGLPKTGAKCRPCANAATAAWRAANSEKIAAYSARYYKENRSEQIAKATAYRLSNLEKVAVYNAEWHQRNKESVAERIRAQRLANPEKYAAMNARWRKANPKKVAAITAAYYAANRQKSIDKARAWQRDNPERVKARNAAAYLQQDRDERNAAHAAWCAANPEKRNAWRDAWTAANPGKKRAYHINRKVRKKAGDGSLSPEIANKLLILQKGKCACCNKSLSDGYHLDHIMPLALGGLNVDGNMQLLTPRCNMHKSKKHPVDYMQSKGFLI